MDKNYNLYALPVVSVKGAIPLAGIRGEVNSLGQNRETKRLYGITNNNNTDNTGNTMPSKSVSYSDEHYARLVNNQPDGMNFSDWVETLESEALDARQDEQSSEESSTEIN